MNPTQARSIMGRRASAAFVLAVLSAACSSPSTDATYLEVLSQESQCGPGWEVQDVEFYDGTLGVTQAFVDLQERSVGRHLKPSGGTWNPACTGTLLTKSLFLSAGHCTYAVGNRVQFNYQLNGDTGLLRAGQEFEVTSVLEQENTLTHDYALVRLALAPGERYGFTQVEDRNPSGGELLTIIQHPDGVPKVVATGPETGAAPVTPSTGPNFFGHQVDTTNGTSGSGVLDTGGRILGVHTDGGCDPENSAMRMTAIFDRSSTIQNLGADEIWWAGNQTFSTQSQSVAQRYQPFSGDFNGDGNGDIFWYRPGTGADEIWSGNGSGGFSSTSTTVNGLYMALSGDFDGNGDDDILWYGPGTASDYIQWSNNGSFTDQSITVNDEYRPFVGDFDGNGDDDIFWYAPGTANDYLWWSNNGSFTSQTYTIDGHYLPVAGDFDNVGGDDIFWHAPGTATDYLWLFSGTSHTSQSKTVNGYYTPFAGDFDGDGDDDIFWYAPGTGSDSIWWWTSGGSFSSQSKTVNGDYWPVVGDFDGDAHHDIFWYGH